MVEQPPWRRNNDHSKPAEPAPPPTVPETGRARGDGAKFKEPPKLDLRWCRVCHAVAYQGISICLNTECVPWVYSIYVWLGTHQNTQRMWLWVDYVLSVYTHRQHSQDLYKTWTDKKLKGAKRPKNNRGRHRPVWWAQRNAEEEEETDEEDDGWEPTHAAPVWKGGSWQDWGGDGHHYLLHQRQDKKTQKKLQTIEKTAKIG